MAEPLPIPRGSRPSSSLSQILGRLRQKSKPSWMPKPCNLAIGSNSLTSIKAWIRLQRVKESAVATQQSARGCQDLSALALTLRNLVSSFLLLAARDDNFR